MAMVTLVPPAVPLLHDASRRLAAAPLRLHFSSSIANCSKLGGARRRRKQCRFHVSITRSFAQSTESMGRRKFAARANGAAPGDLMTEDVTGEEETCEIVQGSNVTLGEGLDTVQAYLIQAIKNNNGVAVLCLTDEYGFENEDSRSFAYRLACFGYNVLVPDLFQGAPWSEESPKNEYEKWLDYHSPDKVAGSIDLATKYLLEEIDTAGKLAVIGFGFGGGRMIETLARDSNSPFATGAFLYGIGFESSLATQIKVPLLLIGGDGDLLCHVDIIRQIEREVPGSQAKIYPGLGHAFVHRPQNSDEDDVSEDAFTEIRHWFHDRLLSESTV